MAEEFGHGFGGDFDDDDKEIEYVRPTSNKNKKVEMDMFAALVNPQVDPKEVMSISEECSGIDVGGKQNADEDEDPSPLLPTIEEEEEEEGEDKDGDDEFGHVDLLDGPSIIVPPPKVPIAPSEPPQKHNTPSISILQTNAEVDSHEYAQLMDDYEILCDRGIVDTTADPQHKIKLMQLPLPIMRQEIYRLKRKWHSKTKIRGYKRYLLVFSKAIDLYAHRISHFTFGVLKLQGFSQQIIESLRENEFDEAFEGIYHKMSKRQISNPFWSLGEGILLCGLNAQLNNMQESRESNGLLVEDYQTPYRKPARPATKFVQTMNVLGGLSGMKTNRAKAPPIRQTQAKPVRSSEDIPRPQVQENVSWSQPAQEPDPEQQPPKDLRASLENIRKAYERKKKSS